MLSKTAGLLAACSLGQPHGRTTSSSDRTATPPSSSSSTTSRLNRSTVFATLPS
jgi:hypothetical protein